MMRLSLQLEMGVFSATLSGLIGMAFGMNLDSSLEEVVNPVLVALINGHSCTVEPLIMDTQNKEHNLF